MRALNEAIGGPNFCFILTYASQIDRRHIDG